MNKQVMIKLETIEMEIFDLIQVQKSTNITLFTKQVLKTMNEGVLHEHGKKIDKIESVVNKWDN